MFFTSKRTLYVVKPVNFGQNSRKWDSRKWDCTIFGRNHKKSWFILMFKIGNFEKKLNENELFKAKNLIWKITIGICFRNKWWVWTKNVFNQLVSVLNGPKISLSAYRKFRIGNFDRNWTKMSCFRSKKLISNWKIYCFYWFFCYLFMSFEPFWWFGRLYQQKRLNGPAAVLTK